MTKQDITGHNSTFVFVLAYTVDHNRHEYEYMENKVQTLYYNTWMIEDRQHIYSTYTSRHSHTKHTAF